MNRWWTGPSFLILSWKNWEEKAPGESQPKSLKTRVEMVAPCWWEFGGGGAERGTSFIPHPNPRRGDSVTVTDSLVNTSHRPEGNSAEKSLQPEMKEMWNVWHRGHPAVWETRLVTGPLPHLRPSVTSWKKPWRTKPAVDRDWERKTAWDRLTHRK